MALDRRDFVAGAGLLVAASACGRDEPRPPIWPERLGGSGDWESVRRQFPLSDDYIHMSAMLITSHPRPVREAIARHRDELDANPLIYVNRHNRPLQSAARSAAGGYLGVDSSDIALTDSTTMGIGLVYTGLRLRPGQEILSTEQDYYVTHEAIRRASQRTGAVVRKVPLYEQIDKVSDGGMIRRVASGINDRTRVIALTWVHSSTGLKLPIRHIADVVERVNAGRDEDDRILLCVDGVHGFGNQDVELSDLGCDFFMAGCHKWLFGPRGTGIVAGRRHAWRAVVPSIPSFIDDGAWNAWLTDDDDIDRTTASAVTPGGFKAFEHQWAMREAFDWHREIGKGRIERRTADLATQLKQGLAKMGHVALRTPMAEGLSAGIVCFDVDGLSPGAVVRRLRARRVIASVTPYAVQHARLTPSIRNTPAEVDAVLKGVRALA